MARKIKEVLYRDERYAKVVFESGHVTKRRVYKTSKGHYNMYVDSTPYVLRLEGGKYYFANVHTPQKPESKQTQAKVTVQTGTPKHNKFEQIKVCVEENIPVYLYGPAGSGKNHTLAQIAESMGLEFYFTNSVQQEYKITGFIDAGGIYHETEFYKAFKNGGLFFLDEIDASIPEVLILLNAAIANKYFEFPNGRIDAHANFRVVAAGNTVGNGADDEYVGRLQLDQATLDRFVLIEFNYDISIERVLANGEEDLVQFIRDLRAQANLKGIKMVFSYRAIITITKLKGKMDLVEILRIAVFKGIDTDTLKTFELGKFGNVYFEALQKLQHVA